MIIPLNLNYQAFELEISHIEQEVPTLQHRLPLQLNF